MGEGERNALSHGIVIECLLSPLAGHVQTVKLLVRTYEAKSVLTRVSRGVHAAVSVKDRRTRPVREVLTTVSKLGHTRGHVCDSPSLETVAPLFSDLPVSYSRFNKDRTVKPETG